MTVLALVIEGSFAVPSVGTSNSMNAEAQFTVF
jgi:hypothetical protein